MMLIKDKLARLLLTQEFGSRIDIHFESLLEHQRDDYYNRADEIIKLFTDAIKNLEFTA